MQYSADLCTEADKVRSDHQMWNQIRLEAVIGDPARTGYRNYPVPYSADDMNVISSLN